MTKDEIIALALSGYPGGDDTGGDTLGLFIERELSDTFEPECSDDVKLSIAIHVLQRAIEDLQAALDPVLQAAFVCKLQKAA